MKRRSSEDKDRVIAFVNDFYRDNHRSPSLRQIAAGAGVPRATAHRMLQTLADDGVIGYDGEVIVTEMSNKINDESIPVGIIGSIPCGNLSLEEEAIEEIVNLPTAVFGKGDLFLLYANGDSMIGAGIDDGDLVLIKRQEYALNGKIVAAFVEGEGNTLKRYREEDGRAWLHPENPKYDDIPLTEGKIQGVAISVIKQL
jgi:repressor LexA